MDPNQIARLITEAEEAYIDCPRCGNAYAIEAEQKIACPNPRCSNFDDHYATALRGIMLPRGLNDYEDFLNWLRLYVPTSELAKFGGAEKTAAWLAAYYIADPNELTRRELAELYFEGTTSLRDNPDQAAEIINDHLIDDYGGAEFFIRFVQGHFEEAEPNPIYLPYAEFN